jgi:hypothetical protein
MPTFSRTSPKAMVRGPQNSVRGGEQRQVIRSKPPASARGSNGAAGAGGGGGGGVGGRKEAFLQDLEADMDNEIARQQNDAKEQYNAVMRHHQPPPETSSSFGRQIPSQATLTMAHSNGTVLHSNGTASLRSSFSNPSSASHYGRQMTPQTTFYHGPASARSTHAPEQSEYDRGKVPDSNPIPPPRRGRSLSRSSQDSIQRSAYPPPSSRGNAYKYSEPVFTHPAPGSNGMGYTSAAHPPPSRDEPVSELERLFRESARMRGV